MMPLLLIATGLLASPKDCTPCHRAETAAIAGAGMTTALVHPDEIHRRRLTAALGSYRYEVEGSNYSVTSGEDTLRIPLTWAFGKGSTGQTFLFRREGRWYESRMSYYSSLDGLDLTLGFQNMPQPRDLLEAAGRLLSPKETKQCFGCHSTAPDIPGVQCERCHGDSAPHLARKSGMRKLSVLSAGAMADFCGECHRTWDDVAANGPRGVLNVRFQPYRLAGSKCYDANDRRISCVACHNPHRPVETAAAAYDAQCQACHKTRATCKVAKKDCVTCHMPRIELPGAHRAFADHWIRVVRKDAPYPD